VLAAQVAWLDAATGAAHDAADHTHLFAHV